MIGEVLWVEKPKWGKAWKHGETLGQRVVITQRKDESHREVYYLTSQFCQIPGWIVSHM